MMTVEVTFDEAGITEIQIPEHSETQIISDPAFERVPANIIEYQSLQMDTVTGATISQFAIISAVADAIAQAGGDASEWRSREGAVTAAARQRSIPPTLSLWAAAARASRPQWRPWMRALPSSSLKRPPFWAGIHFSPAAS